MNIETKRDLEHTLLEHHPKEPDERHQGWITCSCGLLFMTWNMWAAHAAEEVERCLTTTRR